MTSVNGRLSAGLLMPVLPSIAPADSPEAVLGEAVLAAASLFAVTGPSGAGKTVWVQQLAAVAARPGAVRWRVVSVVADRGRRSTLYAVAEQLIHAASPAGRADAARVRTASARSRSGAEADPGSASAPGAAPTLLALAERLSTALQRGLSSRRRLLLVVDDAQWADEGSVRVLRLVLRQLAGRGVCAVLAGRDPDTGALRETVLAADPDRWPVSRRIRIDALDAAGVRRYVSAIHGIEVSLELAERIRRVSGGGPLLVDQVVSGMAPVWAERARVTSERRARFDEDVTDADIARGFVPGNPFGELGAGLPGAARTAVEMAAVLATPLRADELAGVAALCGEPIDIAAASAHGLLISRAAEHGGAEGEREWTVFHDLYGTDVAAHLDDERRARILVAGAEAIPGEAEGTRHRALIWLLDAALLRGSTLSPALRDLLVAGVAESVRARRTEHVFAVARRAMELADRTGDDLADELVVGLYRAASALSALPRMIEYIPRLERAAPGPLRDLALLHVREFRGDYDWVRRFAEDLLARLPRFPDPLPQTPEDVAAVGGLLAPDPLGGLIVRLQVLIVLGIMAPQADPRDFGMERFSEARAGAEWLIAVQEADPETWRAAWAALGGAYEGLPSPHDVRMRATGMQVFGISVLGPAERLPVEFAALGRAIAAAPAESATLFDARVIHAGMLSGAGLVREAAADLDACMRMLRAGTAGWGTGTARGLHIYGRYLLGDTAEVEDALAEAAVTIFDDMDAVGRPVFYALRAVRAADAGDEEAWRADMDAAARLAQRGYDTVGVEYEMLAHIARARARHDPAAQLAVFDPEGPLAGRLLRSQNLYAYKVDALASLGRAEEADRELARLAALPAPGFQPVYASMTWLEGRVHEAYGLVERALRAYRAAAEEDAPGAPLPAALAQAALDAGRLTLATGGSQRTARRCLNAAERGFLRLGRPVAAAEAAALLDGARRSASAVGIRPAPAASAATGPDAAGGVRAAWTHAALTPREREVAALAAEGRTNAEIAQALGISVKAVAFHMGNVLRKLGLGSRRQLRPGEPPASGTAPSAVRDDARWAALSRREREIGELASRDLTDAEIADELGLSVRTVSGHMSKVLAKLGARSRRELGR
nr:AAA family ATPase [Actinomycetota bacterium]